MKSRQTSRDAQSFPAETGPERTLTARVLQAQDEERRKIGRELHDSVGQALAAVKMGIAKFKRAHSIGEDSELDEISRTLDSTIAEVRTISHLLHPPDLDLMGLRATVSWYLEGFGQRTGIQTELDAPEDFPPLPAAADTALFRVVQECLTNVHRHAEASRVVLRVRVTPAEFQLEVSDNGKGFADLNSCREGVGILGMQERLAELAGTLRIESGHTAGSSVFATIPLAHAAPIAVPPQPSPRGGTIRVLVVDDHPAIRCGIRLLLGSEPGIEVCGEAANADQALQLAAKLEPEVMILDLQLGDRDGWSVVGELRATQSCTKILIFSHFQERYFAEAAYRAGCDGAISKGCDAKLLTEAIRTIHAGEKFFKTRAMTHFA
jgi:CheY-like chemotaxis protein